MTIFCIIFFNVVRIRRRTGSITSRFSRLALMIFTSASATRLYVLPNWAFVHDRANSILFSSDIFVSKLTIIFQILLNSFAIFIFLFILRIHLNKLDLRDRRVKGINYS